MVARRQSQTVHYEGHVRAWQGTDVVESSALDVYRTQKRVSSGSQVVTSYLQPAADGQRSKGPPLISAGETRPVTVRADFLEYFDQGRRARYHGNVRLVTESTTLQSDRLGRLFHPGRHGGRLGSGSRGSGRPCKSHAAGPRWVRRPRGILRGARKDCPYGWSTRFWSMRKRAPRQASV